MASETQKMMDAAAAEATRELDDIPSEAIGVMQVWMRRWYLKAGYKRLGKALLNHQPKDFEG